MSNTRSRWTNRAADMRGAFDRSFAAPAFLEATAQEDFLAIRLGPSGYAIRLADIAGIVADKQITRIPGRVAALIGLAGFRGAIVPVYHLGTLLGQPATAAPRWLGIAAGGAIAFAFDGFEGHLRLSADDIVPHVHGEQARGPVRDFVHVGGLARPVVHLPSVLEGIKGQSPGPVTREDR